MNKKEIKQEFRVFYEIDRGLLTLCDINRKAIDINHKMINNNFYFCLFNFLLLVVLTIAFLWRCF